MPWKLLERLDEYPGGEKSGVVEEALTRYLDFGDKLDEAQSRLVESARYVFLNRDLLELRNEQMDGRLLSLEERLSSLEEDSRYVVRVLERLFHIRRHPVTIEVPDSRAFDELMNEASSEYLRNEGLLRPNIHRREHDLGLAAGIEAFENRRAELKDVLNAMPFMNNPRFYIGNSLGGLALFDRNHKVEKALSGKPADFEVFCVQIARGETSLTHSKTRPYCRFQPSDDREMEFVEGIENVAAFIPVLVADYLSFRRLNGEVPSMDSVQGDVISPSGPDLLPQ
ncbi:hypothetical protein LCM4573_26685 [Rhizobium sp. LCM 4573]|nr:hypothetical protein LCM4573_26685 [Rhizobium sp. LCM 4573]